MISARRLRISILLALCSPFVIGAALAGASCGGGGGSGGVGPCVEPPGHQPCQQNTDCFKGSVCVQETHTCFPVFDTSDGGECPQMTTDGGSGSDGGSDGGMGGAGGTSPQGLPGVCYSLEDIAHYMGCAQPEGVNCPAPAGSLTACPAVSEIGTLITPYLVSCCESNAAAVTGPYIKDCLCCYEVNVDMTPVGGCGRPFMVGGESRKAAVMARSDWQDTIDASALGLDVATRRALADGWLDDALMEHASIASFARFSLQMLALGAPPSLVDDSQAASRDEIAHARACFALASRYAGEPLGPGPLSLDGALPITTLVDAAVATVWEGCVGETIASLVAAEQLAVAGDQAVREALSRIARDEAAHASLAYRFVAWAIAEGGEAVRAAVEGAFKAALAKQTTCAPLAAGRDGLDVAALHHHGRLTPAEVARVHRVALIEVIAPCADELSASDKRCMARRRRHGIEAGIAITPHLA